ncbi:Pre-mRNA-splicing factor of RES complex-domain-containing protein [Limtongia smithiae]|uniref:Pre-mRNA-splicing factor of RES complex-domain-containing protein n=1 Tax=Limtongia smithiae TaxID=1125753 RepID=UPI0034CFD57F
MSRLDYLAAKYLTAEDEHGDAVRPKKRKRKEGSSSKKHKHTITTTTTADGLIIADDDDSWGLQGPRTQENEEELMEMGEDAPVVAGVDDRPKRAPAGWKKLGSKPSKPDASLITTADDNDEKVVVTQDDPEIPSPSLSSGPSRVGGLKTAAQVKATLDKKRATELAALEASSTSGKHAEVVYRDASGRRIDIAAYKARMEQQQLDDERRKREAAEKEKALNKGLVQELQRTDEERKLSEAGGMSMTRYANDEGLNDTLKEQELWADPAANFLTKKKVEKTSATGLQIYKGVFPPNRYEIPPGHRWDGVDRSNGFEERLLELRTRSKEKKREEDAYASDESL